MLYFAASINVLQIIKSGFNYNAAGAKHNKINKNIRWIDGAWVFCEYEWKLQLENSMTLGGITRCSDMILDKLIPAISRTPSTEI